ncbi:MAG: lytic transglycosylase domain-containing protein, partial [Acetobacteraceae bacterium]
ACMAAAASCYALPPRVLPAIQQVEGGRIGTVAADPDGTSDLGVMQVNTRWLAPLAGITRLTEAEVRARLILDPCFNIAAAAAILRTYRAESHGDLMAAIGDYHSHTPALNLAYRQAVVRAAELLFGGSGRRRDRAGAGVATTDGRPVTPDRGRR